MIGEIARQALRAARKGAVATTGTWIAVLERLNRVLAEGEAPRPPEVSLRELRRMLGLTDEPEPEEEHPHGATGRERLSDDELRDQFAELLARSQAPEAPDGSHPAFRSMIDELTPDEARILRLLADDGPQPVVTVRATNLIGRGEVTILENVTLLGERAGCHHPEAGPAYLDNLQRLGLVRLVPEELPGDEDYDVIESRPEVAEAEEEITEERNQRPRMVRGNARLSRLGSLLCDICLD
ncbi:MAG: DUF4393 domain-containing protein [Nitriliruptorales bacterium]|nr:DUF4393 domain-containing protein [Nitriliruptorales bacterium]